MTDIKTISQTILVVGGGVSGITAAIEAAETGYNVILIEKQPYLGGHVAQLHQYFPKLCPPNCGLEINFKRMKQNPYIKFFTMAEPIAISGEKGNWNVSVRLSPRYVNEKCTCCGKCSEACSTELCNEYNYNMDKVKAAYLPHEFAFPMRYIIDGSIIGTDEAVTCKEACPYDAVNIDDKEIIFDINAGAIIWATGWTPYDVKKVEYYGFGVYKNVITNVMMERLASLDGPTNGKIVRPSDGKEAKKIAFIQCAGSRDENHLHYCSGVCCLASMKQARYIREQSHDSSVTIFYIDIRATDRLENFYTETTKDEKIIFIKSKIAFATEDKHSGDILLEGENTMTGEQIREHFDMVVLAAGMTPNSPAIDGFNIKTDESGFYINDGEIDGFFGAGCVRRPTEVSTSVQDGTAAALKAIQAISRRGIHE